MAELTASLTVEEMVGWAGYFALKNEEEEKERDQIQARGATRTQNR